MRPVLFEWMGVPWFSWHIFFALAGSLAFLVFFLVCQRVSPPIPRSSALVIFAVTYLWMVAGAVLWAIVVEGFPAPVVQLSRYRSLAMSSSGGIIAAVAGFVSINLVLGVKLRSVADAGVLAGLVAFAIGRVGCFLNGDDYGWIAGIPVQLVEAAFCIGAYLWLLNMVAPSSGRRAIYGIILYACMRLLTEPFRDDWRGQPLNLVGLEWSPPQVLAALCLAFALGFLGHTKREGKSAA